MFGARRRGKNKAKAEMESLDHLALEKFEEIVAMLIDAGYYRARIETLSMFDRCIGGLCWAITASGVAVDEATFIATALSWLSQLLSGAADAFPSFLKAGQKGANALKVRRWLATAVKRGQQQWSDRAPTNGTYIHTSCFFFCVRLDLYGQ